MNLSILGTARPLAPDASTWLLQTLRNLCALWIPHVTLHLHVGAQRTTGTLAVQVAKELDIACQLYHPIGGINANLSTWLPPVHCNPYGTARDGTAYRKYAQQVLDAGDMQCIVCTPQSASVQYFAQALANNKPTYLIRLDTYTAEWQTP